MEVLKKMRASVRSCVLAIFAVAIIFAVALYSVGGSTAYADNSSEIGKDEFTITVTDVTEREKGLSYSKGADGATFMIKTKGAVEIAVAYEVQYSEPYWAIGGASKEYPYEITYQALDGDRTLAKEDVGYGYVTGWTGVVTSATGHQTATVKVNINGILYVRCKVSVRDEDGNQTFRYVYEECEVKCIDILAPSRERVVQSFIPQNGSYVAEIEASFVDTKQSGAIPSARSGMRFVGIYYAPHTLSGDGQVDELVESLSCLAQWEQASLGATITQEVKLKFTASENGYYYYLVIDRAGNLGIYDFFGGEFQIQNDSRYNVKTTSNGEVTVINVANAMRMYSENIEANQDKVMPSVYEAVRNAYGELLWAFNNADYDGTEEERIQAVSKQYWGFVNGAYKKFNEALKGVKYDFELINGDLLFGKLRIVNFEGSLGGALGGQTVLAQVNVARYDFNEVPSEVISIANMGKKGKVFKMSYKFTVDGSLSYIPDKALIFELGGDVSTFIDTQKFALIFASADGYTLKPYTKGANWIRFSTELNKADIYVVVPESSLPSTYEVGGSTISVGAIVGIVLGSVACACALCVCAYFILKKKGVIGKKVAPIAEDVDSDTEKADLDKPKIPKNKSKKRKKK